jgi:hypothetical protein
MIALDERISRYVAKLDPSVSGQNGHNSLLIAAGALATGFGLSDELALPFLIEFNQGCMPPWPHGELKRKLKEARKKSKKPLGYLLSGQKVTLEIKPVDPEPYVPPRKPELSRFRKGWLREFESMSANRGWSVPALQYAQSVGVLRFGWYFGFDCWISMDSSGICGEARRLDDKPFPAYQYQGEDFQERKANAVKFSKKDWPVGLQPEIPPLDPLYSIVMAEGGPDFISLYHFSFLQNRHDVLPVTMLGNGMAIHNFHPDAIERLRDRRVRIYPHNDANGQGLTRAIHWAKQLVKLGCKVDLFTLEDVFKPDGNPANDLTECVGVLEHKEVFP